MNFKKWVKSIQTAGYNGARTVADFISLNQKVYNPDYNVWIDVILYLMFTYVCQCPIDFSSLYIFALLSCPMLRLSYTAFFTCITYIKNDPEP